MEMSACSIPRPAVIFSFYVLAGGLEGQNFVWSGKIMLVASQIKNAFNLIFCCSTNQSIVNLNNFLL